MYLSSHNLSNVVKNKWKGGSNKCLVENVIGATFNSVSREMKLAVKAAGKLYLEDLRMREDNVCEEILLGSNTS